MCMLDHTICGTFWCVRLCTCYRLAGNRKNRRPSQCYCLLLLSMKRKSFYKVKTLFLHRRKYMSAAHIIIQKSIDSRRICHWHLKMMRIDWKKNHNAIYIIKTNCQVAQNDRKTDDREQTNVNLNIGASNNTQRKELKRRKCRKKIFWQ